MLSLLQHWDEEGLYDLQVDFVTAFMKCDTERSVEISVEFAKYLRFKGLDSDNYLLFMELMVNVNHHIVDALLGEENAFDYFSKVQLNRSMLDFCFRLLNSYSPGGAYERTLETIFGIISKNYYSAKEGLELYPLSIEKINSVGKFLDKSKPQSENLNRIVLNILGNLADLTPINDENKKITIHANNIRNVFFDRREKMDKVISAQLLIRKDYQESTINPRKINPLK